MKRWVTVVTWPWRRAMYSTIQLGLTVGNVFYGTVSVGSVVAAVLLGPGLDALIYRRELRKERRERVEASLKAFGGGDTMLPEERPPDPVKERAVQMMKLLKQANARVAQAATEVDLVGKSVQKQARAYKTFGQRWKR